MRYSLVFLAVLELIFLSAAHAASRESQHAGNSAQKVTVASSATPPSQEDIERSSTPTTAQELALGYHLPPAEIVKMMEAPPTPDASLSPNRQWLLVSYKRSLLSFDEIGAGGPRIFRTRIDATRNRPSGSVWSVAGTGFSLIHIPTGSEHRVNAPTEMLSQPMWAPNGTRFAFLHTSAAGAELWVADTSGSAHRVEGPPINLLSPAARGGAPFPCRWLSDSENLLCEAVPPNRGSPPIRSQNQVGPETFDTHSPVMPWSSSNVHLLESPYDELLFDYYFSSQPTLYNVSGRALVQIGAATIYQQVEPSPSSSYIFVQRTVRPYSRTVTDSLFPQRYELLNRRGELVREITPSRRGAVVGRFRWHATEPSSLLYVQHTPRSSPSEPAMTELVLAQPASKEPGIVVFATHGEIQRFWSGSKSNVFVSEFDADHHRSRLVEIRLASGGAQSPTKRMLLESDASQVGASRYQPLLDPTYSMSETVTQRGDWIYLKSTHADDERPILYRLNVRNRQMSVLFDSAPNACEEAIGTVALPSGDLHLLVRTESIKEAPNYAVRNVRTGNEHALTTFATPLPLFANMRRRVLHYARADGTALKGTLYLAAGQDNGTDLPVILTGYPVERSGPDDKSPWLLHQCRYAHFSSSLGITSPWENQQTIAYLLISQGYALFEADMPILGGATANDSYLSQLMANAEGAVSALRQEGFLKHTRPGVWGTSYGATMVANLLANSRLFAAGVALNGASNLTETPFHYQFETRNLWTARSAYIQTSALFKADQIRDPLLLIAGGDDSDETAPDQFRQLYRAIRGLGVAPTRLTILPFESHSNKARESKLQVAWEGLRWFDMYLKQQRQPAQEQSETP